MEGHTEDFRDMALQYLDLFESRKIPQLNGGLCVDVVSDCSFFVVVTDGDTSGVTKAVKCCCFKGVGGSVEYLKYAA